MTVHKDFVVSMRSKDVGQACFPLLIHRSCDESLCGEGGKEGEEGGDTMCVNKDA